MYLRDYWAEFYSALVIESRKLIYTGPGQAEPVGVGLDADCSALEFAPTDRNEKNDAKMKGMIAAFLIVLVTGDSPVCVYFLSLLFDKKITSEFLVF